MSDDAKCAGCGSTTKRLRECADGQLRCGVCRHDWLERVWAQPVRPVPTVARKAVPLGPRRPL
jgi:hypothetical protein